MNGQGTVQAAGRGKAVAIGLLFAMSAAITFLGIALCAVSAWNRWDFVVFQAKIPGAAFGVVVAFLGMRYTLAVQKLKRAVYQSDTRFSFGNFQKRQAKPVE